MGYIIQYDPDKKSQYPTKADMRSRVGRHFVIIMFVCVTLALAVRFRGTVQDWLIPGNAEITTATFQTLADDLRNGQSVGEAITAFCQEVISHATE